MIAHRKGDWKTLTKGSLASVTPFFTIWASISCTVTRRCKYFVLSPTILLLSCKEPLKTATRLLFWVTQTWAVVGHSWTGSSLLRWQIFECMYRHYQLYRGLWCSSKYTEHVFLIDIRACHYSRVSLPFRYESPKLLGIKAVSVAEYLVETYLYNDDYARMKMKL
jgi:hypothetical protein